MSVEMSRAPMVLRGREPSTRVADGVRQRGCVHGALDSTSAASDYASELMAAVEQEIGDLWRDTIDSGDSLLSDRLVELSHAVRRAALAFENEPAIGRFGHSTPATVGGEP